MLDALQGAAPFQQGDKSAQVGAGVHGCEPHVVEGAHYAVIFINRI